MALIIKYLPYHFHFEITMPINQLLNNILIHFKVIKFNYVLTEQIEVVYYLALKYLLIHQYFYCSSMK